MADDLDVVESRDNYAGLRNAIRESAQRNGHWAGLPMPLDDLELVIEPHFPKALELMKIGRAAEETEKAAAEEKATPRNSFWSTRRRCEIIIWTEPDGKIGWGRIPGTHHLAQELNTGLASVAWGIEQEHNALNLLATMIPHHAFKSYLLTGMFIESSQRSRVAYMFRKLRPTVAISMRQKYPMILACLCLHPIGYYRDSWAGAMCPTDDVVAHLTLMRGDEPMFWKRASQHPPWRPEAGM